jgi:hypothetical protein
MTKKDQSQLERESRLVYDAYCRQQEDFLPFIWKAHDKDFEGKKIPYTLEEIQEKMGALEKKGHDSDSYYTLRHAKIKGKSLIFTFDLHPGHSEERVRSGNFSPTWIKYKFTPRIKLLEKNLKGGQQ